jgi:hypothetical protein
MAGSPASRTRKRLLDPIEDDHDFIKSVQKRFDSGVPDLSHQQEVMKYILQSFHDTWQKLHIHLHAAAYVFDPAHHAQLPGYFGLPEGASAKKARRIEGSTMEDLSEFSDDEWELASDDFDEVALRTYEYIKRLCNPENSNEGARKETRMRELLLD